MHFTFLKTINNHANKDWKTFLKQKQAILIILWYTINNDKKIMHQNTEKMTLKLSMSKNCCGRGRTGTLTGALSMARRLYDPTARPPARHKVGVNIPPAQRLVWKRQG